MILSMMSITSFVSLKCLGRQELWDFQDQRVEEVLVHFR